MSTALFISLAAVAISLFVVFIARLSATTKPQSGRDGGSPAASSDSVSDCSTAEGGACDGGGSD